MTTSSSPKNVTLVTSKGISRHILPTCKCRFLVVRPVESPITLAGLASTWPTILQAAVQSKRPSFSHTVIFIMPVQMECPGMPPVHPALHAPVPAEAQGRARQSTARLDKISDKIRHATHFCSLNSHRREIWPRTATPRKMPAAIRQAAHPRPGGCRRTPARPHACIPEPAQPHPRHARASKGEVPRHSFAPPARFPAGL